ncbi:MAG: LPS export ABC transporter periplasmic protein LptC [Gammaproteobacteria bacterium]|nr:LPS export ABC transporter periplasmic protein LptC [Gammaproteobacteria bacterium]
MTIHLTSELKKSILIIILLIISGLSTYFTLQLVKDETKTHFNKPKNPDAFITNITYQEYDEQGKLHTTIKTPKLVHYSYLNSSKFEQPIIIIYGKNNDIWRISAVHGTADHGNKTIDLIGDVKLHRPKNANNKAITITTDKATVHPKQKTAETTKPINIKEQGFTANAVGAKADLNTGVIKLQSKVKEIYTP